MVGLEASARANSATDAELPSVELTAMRPRFEAFWPARRFACGMTSKQLAAISRVSAGDHMNRRCLLHTVEQWGCTWDA
jgi:hypothetical protein